MKLIHTLVVLLVMAACITPAVAENVQPGNKYTGISGYESKYADPPVSESEIYYANNGHAFGMIKTVGCINQNFLGFGLIWDQEPNTTVDYKFGSDGKWDGFLAPGNYTAILYAGTGSSSDANTWKPETVKFFVNGGGEVRFSFIGAGMSCGRDTSRTRCGVLVIDKGTYGAAPCGEVIDVPAHDEYRVHGHWSFWMGHWYWNHDPFWYPWSDFVPFKWNDIPPTDRDTRYVPPVTHTVCINLFVDVTDTLQGLVECGHLNIAADYPNLHYNDLFGDPAPGAFKSLTVKYTLNGVTDTVIVDEATDLEI